MTTALRLWLLSDSRSTLSVLVIDFTFDGTMTDCFILPSCGKPTTRTLSGGRAKSKSEAEVWSFSEQNRSAKYQKRNSIKLLLPCSHSQKFPKSEHPHPTPYPTKHQQPTKNLVHIPKSLPKSEQSYTNKPPPIPPFSITLHPSFH